MAAPWEKYAAPTATAPWEKYAATQPKDDYSDPLKGFKVSSPGTRPKIDMKEAPMPGLTKVALEGVVKPANSALKGYNEGVVGGAKMLGNVAKGIENVTGLKRGGLFDEMDQVHRQNAADLEGRGADGVAGALYEAGGRLAPDLAKYTLASAAMGPTAGMAAVDAATEADKGVVPALEAGAKGAMMGGTLHVSQGASLPYRVGGMAAAGGGQAALSGGTPTDIAANAITMGAMAVPGGRGASFREARQAVKQGATNLETQARRQAEREWAQTNVADAMGVRPLAEKTIPGTSPGQIKAKAKDIAAQDIIGKPFGKLSKKESAQVSAALRDKELRKHYEQQAKDVLPQGDQILPDGSPVPLGPDLKAAQANRKAKLAAKFGTRAEREAAYQEGLADARRKPATPPELEWPAPLKSAEESAAVLRDIPVQPAVESAGTFAEQSRVRTPQEWALTDAQGRPAPPRLEAPIIEKPGGSFAERIEAPKPPAIEAPGANPPMPSESVVGEQPSPDLKWDKYAPKGEDGFDSGYDLTSSFKAGSAESPRTGNVSIFYKADEQFPTFDVVIEEHGTPNKRGEVHRESFDWVGEEAAKETAARFMDDAGFSAPRDPGFEPGARDRTRRESQRGGLTVPNPFAPKQQNLTPSEQYANQMAAEQAAAKRGPDSAFMEKLNKIRDRYRTAINDTTVKMTDTLSPLDDAADKAKTLRPTTEMHSLIDKAYRSSTIASKMLEQRGILDAVDNVKDLTYLDQFMIARRAVELEANGFASGREFPQSDRQLVADFKDQVAIPAKDGMPAQTYSQVADRFTSFNNELLDMSVRSGVINADLAAHLKAKYKNYIPIDRIMDIVESTGRGGKGQSQVASLARQTIVKSLVGSERVIDNSIVASVRRADRVLGQITRNDAGRFLTDHLQQLDPGDGSLIAKLKEGEVGPTDRTIHNFVNGKKESYVTTPEIAAAAKSLDVKQLGWFVQKIFNPAVRVLKAGTTGLDPRFILRNINKDIWHTATVQEGGLAALAKLKTWKEMGKAAAGRSDVVNYLEGHGGAVTSFDIARGQVMPDLELRRAMKGAGSSVGHVVSHPVRSMGALLRATENFLGRSEQMGRARIWQTEYARAVKDGYSKRDAEIMATVESNNALPNYSRAGSIGRTLNAILPYFNARIQGTRSLVRGIEKNPMGTISKIALGQAGVAAAVAWNLMDDERRKVYMDIMEYERQSALMFVLPGAYKDSKGQYHGVVKIGIAQGLDSLYSPSRKAIEHLYGGDKVGFKDMADSLVGAFTPVTPAPISDNPLVNAAAGVVQTIDPQVIKPSVEGMANHSFFRDQPIEPLSMQDRPAQDRAFSHTSGVAKALARKVLPKVGLETSPIKVEEWIKGSIGGVAQPLINAADRAAMAAGIIPEQTPGGRGLTEYTLSGVAGARGGQYDNEYFKLRRKAQDIITHRNIATLQSNPYFAQLPSKTQEKLTRSEVAKARAIINKITNKGKLDDEPGPRKVEVMRQFLEQNNR